MGQKARTSAQTSQEIHVYRCRVVYAHNKCLTLPVSNAKTAQEAAALAAQTLKQWLDIEVWQGCDRVFVRSAHADSVAIGA
jgi:hypothetical protein